MDEIILIDKPAGMTSFGVVARIRRVLSNQAGKKVKVGHTGTLDPFATGLMIIVAGKETKNAMTYTKLDKVYEATFVLGQTSTTGDPEGELSVYRSVQTGPKQVRAEGDTPLGLQIVSDQPEPRAPTLQEVMNSLKQFTGEIKQRPPIFSAIKINGQRAYKLARDGKEVEIPERTVSIYSLELASYDYPELKIRTHVSSGTYIRSLGVDIGEALSTGAYCSELRRTRIADWDVADAKTLESFGIEN